MTDILNQLDQETLNAAVENIMAGTLPPNQALALQTLQHDVTVILEWNCLLTACRDLLAYERDVLPSSAHSPDPKYCKKILHAVQCNADMHKAMDKALDAIEIKDERPEDASVAAAAFMALNLKGFGDGGAILRRIKMIMLFKPTGKSPTLIPVSYFFDRLKRKFSRWMGWLFG